MSAEEEAPRVFAKLPDMPDKAEPLYQSLFVHNLAIMLLIDPESGEIRDANVAASNYYGYTPLIVPKNSILI